MYAVVALPSMNTGSLIMALCSGIVVLMPRTKYSLSARYERCRAIFRVGSAVGQTVGVLFAAQLYGVTPSVPQLVTIVITVVLTTFTVPGIPGGSIVVMVPVLLAAHLPVAGIGVLLGVDTIPDMFRTTANVTGGIAAAAILGRRARTGLPEDDRAPA